MAENLPNFRSMTRINYRYLCTMLLIGSALALCGCYGFSATTLPAHLRTVQIHEVENKTLDPVLGNRLRDGIRQLFRRNASSIRQVNEDANADFFLTLNRYSNNPENFSQSDVETYRVTMVVDVKFIDNVKDRTIYEAKNLSAYGVYDISKNETEDRHGQERAIEKLQELIVTNALSRW